MTRLRVSAGRQWLDDRRFVMDIAVAGLLTVLALVDVVADEVTAGERAPDILAFALAAVAGVSLVWRRRAPITVLSVVGVAMVTYWVRGHGAFLAVVGLPSLYAVVLYEPNRRRAWTAAVVASAAMLVAAGVSVLNPPDGFLYPNAVTMAAYLAGAAGVGVVVRNRERIFVDTQRRAEQAEADRRAEAERAVALERSRIAREMHDVVAHGMTAISVQAAAALEMIDAKPHKAAEALARIATVSRESLTEMRRMLGVLRTEDDNGASFLPQPRLEDIATMVDNFVLGGIAAELVVSGSPRELPPGVELTAYRIVQEALTNVRKHAGHPTSVTVELGFGARDLIVYVSDDALGGRSPIAASGAGHGLMGMRERVEIYDGTLTVGPRPDGGFSVRAALPIDAPTEPEPDISPSPAAEIS